jgi:ATP synthase protein I
MERRNAQQVRRVLIAQLVVTFLTAAGALPFGARTGVSALIGGSVCLAANALVAFWIFRWYRAQDPGLLVTRLYAAEVAKVALVLGLFAVAFVTIKGLNLPALLGAYLAVQLLSPWFASVWGARLNRER